MDDAHTYVTGRPGIFNVNQKFSWKKVTDMGKLRAGHLFSLFEGPERVWKVWSGDDIYIHWRIATIG